MRLRDFALSSTAWFSTWINISDTPRNVEIFESKRIYRLAGRNLRCNAARCSFCRGLRCFFFAAPEGKCVRENDVTENIMRAVIGHVDRRIKLQIARDVARETDCR